MVVRRSQLSSPLRCHMISTNSHILASADENRLNMTAILLSEHTVSPKCLRCSDSTSRFVTRQSNRKGNAGRPYYKCLRCDKFSCFDDTRGIDGLNPRCLCDSASRRQLSGQERGRKVHYVCVSGRCDYFMYHRGADDAAVTVDEDLVEALIRLRFI